MRAAGGRAAGGRAVGVAVRCGTRSLTVAVHAVVAVAGWLRCPAEANRDRKGAGDSWGAYACRR